MVELGTVQFGAVLNETKTKTESFCNLVQCGFEAKTELEYRLIVMHTNSSNKFMDGRFGSDVVKRLTRLSMIKLLDFNLLILMMMLTQYAWHCCFMPRDYQQLKCLI